MCDCSSDSRWSAESADLCCQSDGFCDGRPAWGGTVICGHGGNTVFLFMTYMMSLSSGACVLIAQYYGKKDKERISKIVGFILKIGMIAGVLVSLLVICIPGRLLSLYTNEEVLICARKGSRQFRAVYRTAVSGYPVFCAGGGNLGVGQKNRSYHALNFLQKEICLSKKPVKRSFLVDKKCIICYPVNG